MLFQNTIFDDRLVVNQKEFFEYASITVPLMINPQMVIRLWEHTVSYINMAYDKSSLRNSDLE